MLSNIPEERNLLHFAEESCNHSVCYWYIIQDSVVSMDTRVGVEWSGVRILVSKKIFFLTTSLSDHL